MMKVNERRLAVVITLWMCHLGQGHPVDGSNPEEFRIDPNQQDVQIRQALLHETPVGMQADRVLDFICSRLYYEGGKVSGIGSSAKP